MKSIKNNTNKTVSKKFVPLRDVVNYMQFEPLFYSEHHQKNKIIYTNVKRIGMEFVNVSLHKTIDSVVVLGQTENEYLERLSQHGIFDRKFSQEKMLENLFNLKPPCIICCKRFKYENLVLEHAKKYDIPVFYYSDRTYILAFKLIPFLNERIGQTDEIHGTCMNIFNQGVIIQGESGIGKSELALSLIHRGHYFVSDDRTIVYYGTQGLSARAPKSIANLIEVRGIGIINLKKMYGSQKIIEDTHVNIIIELVKSTELNEVERVNYKYETKKLLDEKIAYYRLPVTEGRLMWAIVEAAVLHKKFQDEGYNSVQELTDNLNKLMNEELED
ncbi:HPr(Ser) kinase/phosphatase [Mycoplasma sp. (ex Biomphalaria glabrata)]|uniref:HPr(Ser) kinase/phosphatase n=1 Tax=Mycoplasma sp. (ex Biomphalaria glabrata) TaxID=1749074 RepID=UPI000A1099B4|nr:HPr(Ser) kinase/phosphatase [Mycoplasma sp. (ex Biomphalaria glabrata)]